MNRVYKEVDRLGLLDSLYHYNHNHDRLGRFAATPGGRRYVKRDEEGNSTLTGAGKEFADSKGYKDPNDYKFQSDLNKRVISEDEAASKGFNAASNLARTGSSITKRGDDARSGRSKKAAYKEAAEMTDEELRARVNRMNLERNYAQLTSDRVGSGKSTVTKILDTAGDILAMGASAATIALSLRRILFF